ncbi:hypothetical protein [Methanolobus psychrotolerans]|uniref:hypothetical protein n=1 Tax=Methanolobus psychrotolerans TaxID=1874706 RepID=UPI0013E9A7FD|nr:hypothetical protein [Methanolobus psychrotolerans]
MRYEGVFTNAFKKDMKVSIPSYGSMQTLIVSRILHEGHVGEQLLEVQDYG